MLYLIKNTKNLIMYYFIMIIICIVMSFTSIITSNMMGKLTYLFTTSNFNKLGINILITVLLFIIDGLVYLIYTLLCGKIEANGYLEIQKNSFYKISHISIENPLINNYGDLYSRINSDTNEVVEYISKTLPTILMQGIQLILISLYILLLDWHITIIYLFTLFISLLVQSFLSKALKIFSIQLKNTQVKMNTSLKNNINNRITIKVYKAYNFINSIYKKIEKELFLKNIYFNIVAMPIHILGLLFGIIPIISLCLAGLFLISKNIIDITLFMTIFFLCQKILPYQLHYIDLFINSTKVKPSFNRIIELWNEPLTNNNKYISSTNGEIVLDNVWYKYPNTDNWIIKGISLTIPKGKKVAFIGKSGCGKSTLLKIIGNLILPQKGNIKLPITILTSQFPTLFSGTIKQNICCFEDKEDQNIISSCENSGANVFISQLENNINFEFKNSALNLSGGQRQRIAIARALNSQNSILLFDESLSALDAKNANEVIKKIIEKYPSTTIIMILHQYEFLPLMDEIYLIENGKIVDFGSYDELNKKNLL